MTESEIGELITRLNISFGYPLVRDYETVDGVRAKTVHLDLDAELLAGDGALIRVMEQLSATGFSIKVRRSDLVLRYSYPFSGDGAAETEGETPGDIGSLVELQEFPGYYLDMQRVEVWSHRPRWNSNGPTWQKLVVSPAGGVGLLQGGRHRSLRIGKLFASVRLGVSYDRLPRLYSFGAAGTAAELRVLSHIPIGEVIDVDAINAKVREMRRERNHALRIERAKRGIEGLQLLLKAFEGDAGPLIEFVAASFERYKRRLLIGGYHTTEDIQDAYDDAFYLLTKQLERTDCRLYDIDRWMICRMRYYLANLPKRTGWQEYMNRCVESEIEPQSRAQKRLNNLT